MNELKFGHRVLAWDYDKDETTKGRLVAMDKNPYMEYPFEVLPDEEDEAGTSLFVHAELDPDATEFLPGDEVEMSDDKVKWELTQYGHKSLISEKHYDIDGNIRMYCRYPKKDPFDKKIIQINEKIYQLKEMPNVIYKNPPLVRINLPCES